MRLLSEKRKTRFTAEIRFTAGIRFTAEAQRTPRFRREKHETSLFPSLRFLRVLCVSVVETNRNPFSVSYKARQSLLLFVLTLCSCFAPLVATAQTGVITGRVVAEDGGGLPNVTV